MLLPFYCSCLAPEHQSYEKESFAHTPASDAVCMLMLLLLLKCAHDDRPALTYALLTPRARGYTSHSFISKSQDPPCPPECARHLLLRTAASLGWLLWLHALLLLGAYMADMAAAAAAAAAASVMTVLT